MEQPIFQKFSQPLKEVLILAEKTAIESGVATDTDHILLALSEVKDTLAFDILSGNGITPERIRLIISLINKREKTTVRKLSVDAKEAIQEAVKIASLHRHGLVDCEHLLLTSLKNRKYNSYLIVERMGSNPQKIAKQVEELFRASKEMPPEPSMSQGMEMGDAEMYPEMDMLGPIGMPGAAGLATKTKKESLLETYATNLTAKAERNEFDTVVGREPELLRIIQILSRRTKNNPVLVGEPGVGKTSVVIGLAQKIVSGHVPLSLHGKEIYSLDIGALVAGTMYRGQFENRMKKLLAEIQKKKNIIVFIDEIHMIVGAGASEGSVDAANLLKPVLSEGSLRVIGSTTFDEYKKHIEKDPAFERRFQPVKILEPSITDTICILKGIRGDYERHHGVKYTDDALVAATRLSKRYINDRFLPDKAIDLIDEAAASINSQVSKNAVKLMKLKKDLRQILKKKDDLISSEKYQDATLLRRKEILLENQIQKIKLSEKRPEMNLVDEDQIAEVVSRWTGIPVNNLSASEKKRFINLESRLKKSVIGQDQAIREISKAIKRARVGISNPNRPMGVFIFLGPTGVGKTELAKVLAREVLGSEKQLIKIDMSEFMERHNLSRLVGAPAGYIGYEEGGKLTEIVRKNPYAIILFDEIEKAHPEVFNILLQVMEDGELSDAKGRKIDFKNTILIMTSNLGTSALTKQAQIGFGNGSNFDKSAYEKIEAQTVEAIERHFKPEFVNRIDKVITFKPLSLDSIKKIVVLELGKLEARLSEHNISISYKKEVIDWLAKTSFDPAYGARPVRKTIADFIEVPLSESLLRAENEGSKAYHIDIVDEKLVLS